MALQINVEICPPAIRERFSAAQRNVGSLRQRPTARLCTTGESVNHVCRVGAIEKEQTSNGSLGSPAEADPVRGSGDISIHFFFFAPGTDRADTTVEDAIGLQNSKSLRVQGVVMAPGNEGGSYYDNDAGSDSRQ